MKYDWIVVGGGITGIALSEILTREGKTVLLIEKKDKLAGETTRGFHEWIHTGSLYTLIPDNLFTLKFIVGAIDDLLDYYYSFSRMNLVPTESGLCIAGDSGWFQNNYIHFNYRLKGRKIFIPWLLMIARSEYLIERLGKHDWLRKRAGINEHFKVDRKEIIGKNFMSLLFNQETFHKVKTTDFTVHSRLLLRDILTTAIHNNLEVSLNDSLEKIETHNGLKQVTTEKGTFKAKNVVLCTGKKIAKYVNARVKTTFAPIAVVEGLSEDENSFVNLDYYTKNCVNVLTKGKGLGLVGGISLDKKEKCDEYLDFVVREHRKTNPSLRVLERYIGEKDEIIIKNQNRNYLYHINRVPGMENVWTVIPGKFTLAFSLAPEFYRRVYKKNPRKFFKTYLDKGEFSDMVSETRWFDAAQKKA